MCGRQRLKTGLVGLLAAAAAMSLSLRAEDAAVADERASGALQRGSQATRLAVLPALDLANGKADTLVVDALLERRLGGIGFDVLAADEVLAFLRRHRMRYTGGMTHARLSEMRAELSVEAVFVVSIDSFEVEGPPRVALNARIVSTESGNILWAGEVAAAGEEHPGVLGLRTVDDVEALLEGAVERLLAPLRKGGLITDAGAVEREPVWKHRPGRKGHRPKKVFRAPELDEFRERPPRVAVLPMENNSNNADAGGILAGLFATHLAGRGEVTIIEPGEVRRTLLRGRVIQQQGLSLPQADFLREMADVDLAVSGRLMEFQDFGAGTVPRVVFSVWIIDVRRRSVVWSGYSANLGDDGVVFFRHGHVATARALASSMVEAAVTSIVNGMPSLAKVGRDSGTR